MRITIDRSRRKRGKGEIPWGFDLDPTDTSFIIPDNSLLDVLEAALNYRARGYSARKVAAWVTAHSGRQIDHRVLDRRLTKERRLYRDRQRSLPPLIALKEVQGNDS